MNHGKRYYDIVKMAGVTRKSKENVEIKIE